MKNVTVNDIILATSGKLLSGEPERKLLHISTDSRTVSDDTLFVPIKGENHDGHDYIETALLSGAPATLTSEIEAYEFWCDNHPYEEKIFILVENTTDAVQKIGKMARLRLSLPAIGVTGSVGKTTTREMISAALSAEKKVYKTGKNFNNWLGVPITLCEMSDEDDIAVLELGLNVRGELGLISSLANIETAVITNIGVAHMEFYGTQDEICREKFTVTKGFSPDNPRKKMLFLCGDDPYLMKYKELTGYPYTVYGTKKNALYRAENVRVENGRYTFEFVKAGKSLFTVSLSVLGAHNVLNACAALGVADYYGVDLQKAKVSVEAFTGFKSRLERFEKNGTLLIDDTYNASPDSMKSGLSVLTSMQYGDGKGRRIAVLGDMFELGPDSPVFHYEVGTYAAGMDIDEMYLIGKNAAEIRRGMEEKGSKAVLKHFGDRESLLQALKEDMAPGDIIYIKASNGMRLREITEGILHDGE